MVVVCVEIGGVNFIEFLVVGVELGFFIVDVDGMGWVFFEL